MKGGVPYAVLTQNFGAKFVEFEFCFLMEYDCIYR